MRVLNQLDRFHLAKFAVMLQPKYAERSDAFIAQMDRLIAKQNCYIRDEGADLPEVADWKWTPINIEKSRELYFPLDFPFEAIF